MMQRFDLKFWLAAAAALFFFYKWNEACFQQTLALPLIVEGYEARTGKEAPARVKMFAADVERRAYVPEQAGRECACKH